jgi:hypothetical protein
MAPPSDGFACDCAPDLSPLLVDASFVEQPAASAHAKHRTKNSDMYFFTV